MKGLTFRQGEFSGMNGGKRGVVLFLRAAGEEMNYSV
jgi:hypothetical protein